MVVLHHTAMAGTARALKRLCDPGAEVSAHYLISERGVIWQLVDEDRRAWHAGAGAWGGVQDVNSHSIGIELANPGPLLDHPPFPEAQMAALEWLLARVMTRHGIAPRAVIAHSDMAPARKADPGPAFDWRRLALAGLAVWPDGDGDAGTPFLQAAARFGYDTATNPPEAVLAAFRLRFRPWASGPEDATDRALMAALARDWPWQG